MVLKKQNGMQRGRAGILAACICTAWERLSGCLLGRGKVEKYITEFWPVVPLGVFPICPGRSNALECFQRPAAGQGQEGIPCRGRLVCECLWEDGAGKIWSQGSAFGHRGLVGRGQNRQFPLFHILCPPPLLHSFLCAFTSPVSVQDKLCRKPRLALKAAAKGEKFSISSISSIRDFFPVTW